MLTGDSFPGCRRDGRVHVAVRGNGTLDPTVNGSTRQRQGLSVAQYIYSMHRVRKAHGDKVILDDVTLAFLPGAKIGVVGPNGAGKSSVLKIMAGLDQPSNGDAVLAPGYTVGILLQEPELDETKDVRGNVEAAVGETRSALQR